VSNVDAPAPGLPIAGKDVAETFAESDVSLSHTDTEVKTESIGLAKKDAVLDAVTVDDFDDGNLPSNPNPDWGDWTGDTGFFTHSSNLNGAYSGSLESDDDLIAVELTRSNRAPLSYKMDAMLTKMGGSGDFAEINIRDGATDIATIQFRPDGDVYLNGGSQIIGSWSANTAYSIEVVMDYENNEATFTLLGTTVTADFENNTDATNRIRFYNDTNGTAIRRFFIFDSIQEGTNKASTGSAYVEWPEPNDVFRWDSVTFQQTLDSETVQVDVQEDDGSGWTTIATDVSRGQDITADPESRVRFKVTLERSDTANNPTLDAIARRWVI
jgi:hypothetical protein